MGKKEERKCLCCNLTFDISEEEYEKFGTRYAHKKCAEKYRAKLEKEIKDKKQLIDYINKLYGTETPPSRIMKQVVEYVKEGKTYEGIYFALVYFHHAKGNPVWKQSPTIGIVPHIYDEANLHYEQIRRRMEKAKKESKEKKPVGIKRIVHKSPQSKPTIKKRVFKMLDDE